MGHNTWLLRSGVYGRAADPAAGYLPGQPLPGSFVLHRRRCRSIQPRPGRPFNTGTEAAQSCSAGSFRMGYMISVSISA